jgi:hypothetical protein
MSNLTRKRLTIAVALLGSQIPGLVLWALSTKATGENPCAYRWGDLNQAAERAGYQAGYRLRYPNGPVATEEPGNVTVPGAAVGINGTNSDTAAAAGFEGDYSTGIPTHQVAGVEGEAPYMDPESQGAIAREPANNPNNANYYGEVLY